jgi:hypothetical protein
MAGGEQARLQPIESAEKHSSAANGALTTFSRRSSRHDRYGQHNSTPDTALTCGSPRSSPPTRRREA